MVSVWNILGSFWAPMSKMVQITFKYRSYITYDEPKETANSLGIVSELKTLKSQPYLVKLLLYAVSGSFIPAKRFAC